MSLILINIGYNLNAQWINTSRQSGMGGSNVCLKGSFEAYQNPAGLQMDNQWQIGIQYQRHHLSTELSTQFIGIAKQFQSHRFSLGLQHSGIEGFSEILMGLVYNRRWTEKLIAGIRLDLHARLPKTPYEQKWMPGFAIGYQFRLSDKLEWLAYFASYLQNQKSYYQSTFKGGTGIQYRYNTHLLLIGEIIQESEYISTIVGIELNWETIKARMGIHSALQRIAFGFGWQTEWLQVNIATSMQWRLGISPQAGIQSHF